jgi:hypothetical protein
VKKLNCPKSDPTCQSSEEDGIQMSSNEESYDDLQVILESRLRCLEQWICDLLIKNQQLRSSLEYATAFRDRDKSSPTNPSR